MSRPGKIDLDALKACLAADGPIRFDLAGRGRLYIDRPMHFLAVHIGRGGQAAARAAVMANASYLLAQNRKDAAQVIKLVGKAMQERFGAFLLIDVAELAEDKLAADAPYLAPFAVSVSAGAEKGAQAALSAFVSAFEKVDARYRAPLIERFELTDDPHAGLARSTPGIPALTIRFAPIYKVPQSKAVYPELRERLVENVFDAALRGAAEFERAETGLSPATHRALGRRVFVDAVSRADRAVDDIASRFDFLLAVTPINADAAWADFTKARFERPPTLLYRPLAIDVIQAKKALFGINLDRFEDPVLTALYREKQAELDLQLSMLAQRNTRSFKELGRALYRSVEPRLEEAARTILEAVKPRRDAGENDAVDYRFVERRARAMIERYAKQSDGFGVGIDVRDDLPSGLMVSNGRLLIARSTSMPRDRVEALLSHEVGVHMLTYYNGSGHGLRLFRSGLAGYEGAQEGLAVFAEYLAGGMTATRLRLLAGRVLAVAGMLDGAGFVDTFRLLTKEHGFGEASAFNATLRVHRGGGLAKDAIYLRGLLEILAHLRGGGALDPFWLGKIAARHMSTMQELSTRGLLRAPRLEPQFLSANGADQRLDRLRAGLSPIDLIAA
ncbi:MAG TPA: flavohemoglobin expression-modulating QEGLA motif protein [Devosia sp.]|nr:flavohemoglobin expression-modulating QEGLA motif protein [Devosia sp.]